MSKKFMKKSYLLLSLVFFVMILSGIRIFWMAHFQNENQVTIENGQLDLRQWDMASQGLLLLDGDWSFYPHQLLMNGKGVVDELEESEQLIQVDPEQDKTYSVRISSIRSASEVYVNGRLLAQSGQVADEKSTYTPKNVPYSASFTADDNGVIDIVVQAANYVDVRSSGIVRSIKFGTEEAIMKDLKLSSALQLIAAVIYLLHAIYALLLYFLGNRQKELLYFSLFTFCAAFFSLISNDEKLFHQLFYIGYEWDFRLANSVIVIGFFALLQCTDHQNLPYWRKVFPFYKIINLGICAITLFLSPQQVITLIPVYFALAIIAIIITILTLYKKIIKNIRDYPLLIFSVIAIIHHFIWGLIREKAGISVVYYPFDLILALGCFASVAFKDYFTMHAETKELAITLQRMNDTKDQFLVNTSHEFKNPLHGMLNMSQSVLQREQHLLQQRSVKELETILSVGQRMTLLLDDLLDVRALSEGKPSLQRKGISIQSIITGVLDMLRVHVEVKPVKIIMQIPDDFPPVLADENRLIQIVFNLLHNAVKFTYEGEIKLAAYIKEGSAYIKIADTGIGIDAAMQKRIFQPYEQINEQQTMIDGGFGLGLSITKQLVELHGGTLALSSVLGEGSVFTFSLQVATEVTKVLNHHNLATSEVASAMSRIPLSPEQISEDGEWNRLRILVVDDDPVNLQVLQAMLPSSEYEVVTVTRGKEVLDLVDRQAWDLVISDVMMPQMSGYELTKEIRKRFSLTELPVLLLTARSQPQDIQSGFLAGANDYVKKPVEQLELKSRITALTTIRRMIQEQLKLEAAWLQAQIQPHFIFNTLSTVMALSEIDLKKSHQLLEEFSHFLRYKFEFQNMDDLISVEEELSIVRSYLHIEKVRFDERLQIVWALDDCTGFKVPLLSIQTIVENAIRHGIMKRIRGGTITIRISVEGTTATIAIEDDGVGIGSDQLQSILVRQTNSRVGVGLINTNQRLKRHFGTGLAIQSEEEKGTVVSFAVKLL